MARKITREKVKKIVQERLIIANHSKVVCIDGRYTPEQSEGAIRVPGGDFGMIMSFAATLKDKGTFLSPDEIVERYSKAKKKEFGDDSAFDFHCDSNHHAVGEIGCGHIAKAVDPTHAGRYGSINHVDVRELFDTFTKHPDSRLTVLDGHHQEKGVILVHGHPDEEDVVYSIHSNDSDGNMYFVADIDRAIKLIKKLTPEFSVGLETVIDPDEVIINYLKQMDATVSLIAADLDKFKVVVDAKGNLSMDQLTNLE